MKRFPFLAVVIAAALIAAVFLIWERVAWRPDDSGTGRAPGRETARKAAPVKKPGRGSGPAPSKTGHPGRQIAVIIDDIGFDLKIVEELAGIPAPIAFAVLPYAPHAAEAARLLHAAGKTILLHLPMEPHPYPGESPGSGALRADMDETEIRRRIHADLAVVPFASGVNNHMGSRFMEEAAPLGIVMDELRKRGLFFVDSRTTTGSRGMASAGQAGVRFAERDLFIDHAPGYSAAWETLTGFFRQGRGNGMPLLMIGHPHAQTVKAIRDALPVWRKEGVRVVPVSACLRIPGRTENPVGPAKERRDNQSASERKTFR